MPIRCVIFDLGRTLIPFSFDPLEPRLGARRAAVLDLAARYEIGGCDWGAFERETRALTGAPAEGFRDWWCGIFDLRPLLDPALVAATRRARRIGLLSNTNECHFLFLQEKLPWLREFDFFTLSYAVGAAKPAPAIYADAEKKAECAAEEILYFDDIPEFVAGAVRRGWRAELFTGEAGVRASLRRHGIA